MVSLPQLVRRRLQKRKDEGPHLDPDLLTAFAESCLPNAERTHVLRHVAACADCREIVFLALPHVEAKQEAIAKTRVRWMQWPALRWGAVAACALVVGAAVTLHRQPRSEMAAPAVAGTGSDRDAMASKTSSATSRPADRVVMNDRKDDTEKASDNFAKSQAVNPTFAMRNSHSEARREYSPPQLAKTTPVPALGFSNSDALSKLDTRPRSSRDVDRRGEKRDEVASSLARNAPSAPPAANAEPATGKAKEPLSKNEIVAEAKKSAPANEQGETASGGLVLAPRWTLSADGTLQRSFNAGTTWETIPVTANAKLRALAAIGNEIWVGGSAGALYHSSDAGNHWTQVQPTSSGRSLNSDIIGVEFTDTQHGKLTLADGEAWTTVDGGQSWNTTR
jgi:hypothetical protein